MRWGYCSLTVPLRLPGISPRSTVLCSENDAVGPCGKWLTVRPVGVPRCSWRSTISVSPALCDDRTRSGRMRLPRLSRTEVGRSSRISFEKVANRLEGSREVVTPALRSGRDSSYWKSFRRDSSWAMEGSMGRPAARALRSFARFSLVSASLRTRAWR